MSAAKTKAQNLINENGVVVFSKSYCPYCKSSKDLLDKLGAKYELLELDQIGELLSCSSCLLGLFWGVALVREGKSFALYAGNGMAAISTADGPFFLYFPGGGYRCSCWRMVFAIP